MPKQASVQLLHGQMNLDICTARAQAVPVYLSKPDHEPEHRYQENVVDNVVVPHLSLMLYIVPATTSWKKYRIPVAALHIHQTSPTPKE